MKRSSGKAENVKIAYIGGGSRGWAWDLMSDLASEPDLSGTVALYDLDLAAARDNEVIGNRLSAREDVRGKWIYKAEESIGSALEGSDIVVISILPGTFDEMGSDVHTPEKYGIYQSVGDSTGPGGLVRALRTVPMYVEIAESIKKYAPEAWVINYTNPMSICTNTLYKVFPGIKAFGCCHEVFATQHLLAEMLMKEYGYADVSRNEIHINVLGINHFTWIDRANCRGVDLFPLYRKFVDKYYETGYYEGESENRLNNCFSTNQRVKFDLFRRYGLIASAGDRHLAEFMPPWYLKDPATVEAWGFGLTPVSWRVGDLGEKKAKSRRLVSGEDAFKVRNTGEEGVKQIKALLGIGSLVTNVNLPNRGQMKDMPAGAVVETNALFTLDSVQPVVAGELPADVRSLVIRHVLNHDNIVNAALNKDRDLAFKAFVNDPLVSIGINEAKQLFDEMLANTARYLHF